MIFSVTIVTYDVVRLKYLISICNFITSVINIFSMSFYFKV